MGIPLNVFRLYHATSSEKYFLLRTLRPGFSNYSQPQEDAAEQLEQAKWGRMIQYLEMQGWGPLQLLGEMWELPVGDALYAQSGRLSLPLFYQETQAGYPFLVLGCADTATHFEHALRDDENLRRLQPLGTPRLVEVQFLTEWDVDLSALAGYDKEHIND